MFAQIGVHGYQMGEQGLGGVGLCAGGESSVEFCACACTCAWQTVGGSGDVCGGEGRLLQESSMHTKSACLTFGYCAALAGRLQRIVGQRRRPGLTWSKVH